MQTHEVFAAQVLRDLETKTRAQLLDLLELALPTDKFQLVKRNVDTILRSCVERVQKVSAAVEHGDDARLAHWLLTSKYDGFTCGCGAHFPYEGEAPARDSAEYEERYQKTHKAFTAHTAQFK